MRNKQEKYQGLTMEAKQITHRTDGSDMQGIHWDITVSKGKQSLTLEYTEGLGNFVNYDCRRRIKNSEWLDECITQWLTGATVNKHGIDNLRSYLLDVTKRVEILEVKLAFRCEGQKINISPPKLGDIIYCLSMDSQAINETFEDWASGCGYSDDSIKAKDIYDTCIKRAIELKQLGVDLDALAAEMEDY